MRPSRYDLRAIQTWKYAADGGEGRWTALGVPRGIGIIISRDIHDFMAQTAEAEEGEGDEGDEEAEFVPDSAQRPSAANPRYQVDKADIETQDEDDTDDY